MKKVFLTALSCLLLASCADSDSPVETSKRREIKIAAGLKTFITRADDEVIEEATFPANTEDVLSIFAMKKSPSEELEKVEEKLYFAPTSVNSGESSALTFAEKRYYPSSASEILHFYAFAPSVSADNFTENKEAKYELDGSQDIMWTKNDRDFTVTTAEDPSFNLNHKLMKITFAVKGADDFASIPVTSITINNAKSDLTLNALDGSMTWGDKTITIPAFSGNTSVTSELADLGGAFFMQPVDVVNITVVAGGVTYKSQNVPLPHLEDRTREGISHKIVLTFYPKSIGFSVVLTNWEDGGNANFDLRV